MVVEASERPPNVVVIMTDNHGAWTLGCYGNPEIRTPHIDQLAAQGVRFDQAFASNPVCSPTRATFLTGLMPSQHGVHCFLHGGRLQIGPEARNTLEGLASLPEVLRDAGYTCGLVGKWHLGDNLRPQEGFDDYWITMPHGGTSTFYDAQIIENGRLRKEPRYLTDFWTDHAVRFIQQNKDSEKPFFLYLAYNGPYALGRLLLQDGRNRHAAYYADKRLDSFPREAPHPWQFNNLDYMNNPVSLRRVATEVSGVDDGVGRILETLKQNGLDQNTLILFLADQGWVGGHGGFFGMGDHTRPVTATDGMMRIPMIWRHPGRIPEGRVSDLMVGNYDILPTVLNHLGLSGKMPREPKSPGRDFQAVLAGQPVSDWDNTVFYEFERLRCVRTERWKYVHRHPAGPHELYDLQADPAEQSNLIANAEQANTVQELKARIDRFFGRYAEPKYDLWQGGGSQTVLFQGRTEDEAQLPDASPPPLPDGFEPADLRVPDGFTVELAAGPPLVEFPMMACLDDRGRMFIAESAGLNLRTDDLETQLPNFIRLLEDTDRDGRFDKSTIFADKMTLPQGALWHDGALYVASPPNIWRLEDTDNDGVADRREVLVGRFGYTGNAASVHGCFLHPNGRIYWCDGRHGHEFQDAEGRTVGRGEGSYVFSCKPDGSDVRAHCGGGMDNPVEVDFTDAGDVLGTVNILYSAPRDDCLVHWLHGGTYPHSERVLGEFKRTGALLGPVHRFGHVAVSGTTRYRSGALDRNWRDDFFVTIFNTGKLQRVKLQAEGSTFSATQHEFLTCAGRDFHPTDVLEDADGSLLLVDTGGWFRLGCPTSQIAKPEVKGGIYRIRRTGMPRINDPWGLRVNWTNANDRQLVALLNDTRFKVRERAVTELARRGEPMVAALATAVNQADIRQRLGAVWALTRIGTPAAQTAVRPALRDRDAGVRQAACNSAATTRDRQAIAPLLELLVSETPAVRRVAAQALGRIGEPLAIPQLLEALGRPMDRSQEHALIYALIEIGDPNKTAPGLADNNPAVRRGALIALQQMEARLQPDTVIGLLNSDDPASATAALEVFEAHPEWSDHAAKVLQRWLDQSSLPPPRREIAGRLLTTFLGYEPVAALVGRVLAGNATTSDTRLLLLRSIQDAENVDLHASWPAAIEQLLETADGDVLLQTITALTRLKTDRFDARLQHLAADGERSPAVRVAALEASVNRKPRLSDPAFTLLIGVLSDRANPGQAGRAAAVLSHAELSNAQLLSLSSRLADAGPLELHSLIKPFARSGDADLGETFLTSVRRSPGF